MRRMHRRKSRHTRFHFRLSIRANFYQHKARRNTRALNRRRQKLRSVLFRLKFLLLKIFPLKQLFQIFHRNLIRQFQTLRRISKNCACESASGSSATIMAIRSFIVLRYGFEKTTVSVWKSFRGSSRRRSEKIFIIRKFYNKIETKMNN